MLTIYVFSGSIFACLAVIAYLAAALKKQSTRIFTLASDKQLLADILMEVRDTWDHLPRFIPMNKQWADLSREIGWALPRLLSFAHRVNVSASTHRFSQSDFEDAGVRYGVHELLCALVTDIDDRALTTLWQQCRLLDLAVILRLALFKTWQPGFDLSALYHEGIAVDKLASLEEAIRMMGLDPTKVANFVSAPHNACCKSILFESMGVDAARLRSRSDPAVWREMLDTLR